MFEDTTGHVCKDVWKPAIGKMLHAQQELDNAVDKFAVRVTTKQSAIYCASTREFCGIQLHVAERNAWK